MNKGIGGHTKAYCGKTNEWLTPPDLIKSLGEFDLDPLLIITHIIQLKNLILRLLQKVLVNHSLSWEQSWIVRNSLVVLLTLTVIFIWYSSKWLLRQLKDKYK